MNIAELLKEAGVVGIVAGIAAVGGIGVYAYAMARSKNLPLRYAFHDMTEPPSGVGFECAGKYSLSVWWSKMLDAGDFYMRADCAINDDLAYLIRRDLNGFEIDEDALRTHPALENP